jgi:deoxyribose-phosphate aldolase
MEREELVARVTQEVIRRLGATTASPDGTGAGVCDPCTACGLCVEKQPEAVESIIASGADRISAGTGLVDVRSGLAGMIDHTLLKPAATRDEITALCDEAKRYGFASVCIQPCYVALAAQLLRLTNVKVCTVAGFPLGVNRPETKSFETERAIADGAQEIDMVANVGALKSRDDDLVERDIRAVVEACRSIVVSKVIIEAALLTDEEKVRICRIAKAAGADFVKTSTGFGPGGATAHDVRIMRATVGEEMGVKAAGGIRDTETAREMIEAGASRIGASASIKIVGG